VNAKTRALYGALSWTGGASGKEHEEPSEKSGSQNCGRRSDLGTYLGT
jgi:hypothetical protein